MAESNEESEYDSNYANNNSKEDVSDDNEDKDLDNNKVEDLHKDLEAKESAIMAHTSKSQIPAACCSTRKKKTVDEYNLRAGMGKMSIDTPSFKCFSLAAGVLAWSLYKVQGDNHEEVFIDLLVPTLPTCGYKVAVSQDGMSLEVSVG